MSRSDDRGRRRRPTDAKADLKCAARKNRRATTRTGLEQLRAGQVDCDALVLPVRDQEVADPWHHD